MSMVPVVCLICHSMTCFQFGKFNNILRFLKKLRRVNRNPQAEEIPGNLCLLSYSAAILLFFFMI